MFFCANSASKKTNFFNENLKRKVFVPVCIDHAPGKPKWQRANRLVIWAGGIQNLTEKYQDKRKRIRSKKRITSALPRDFDESISADDWRNVRSFLLERIYIKGENISETRLPDPYVYALVRRLVERGFKLSVIKHRRVHKRRGGRPRIHTESKIKTANSFIKKGMSLRSAAKAMGLSAATLSRRRKPLRANKKHRNK